MWIDFEDTWRGPVAWDVASMADTGLPHGHSQDAVAAYPDPVPHNDLAVCHGLRAMFGLCWRFLMVLHFHEREDAARDALRTWFNQTA